MNSVRLDPKLREATPVVVVGMHRSGTRLLAQTLEALGVFMGNDQQADSESITFMLLNESVLQQCGAFWSEPMAAHFLLSQSDFARQLAALTADALVERQDAYFGGAAIQAPHAPAGRGGRSGGAAGVGEPAHPAGASVGVQAASFGWKDPRNTFTLPVWREIFPELRTIHIVRHGVDVAASLSRRHAAALRAASGDQDPPALTVIRDDAIGILSSRRGWTLAEAFTMWEQYVEKARLEAAALPGRSLEVRFEDLLAAPAECIANIARFCGIASVPDAAALPNPQPERAFAFRRDDELREFAASVAARLERNGYPG